jgi:hypothetical protein
MHRNTNSTGQDWAPAQNNAPGSAAFRHGAHADSPVWVTITPEASIRSASSIPIAIGVQFGMTALQMSADTGIPCCFDGKIEQISPDNTCGSFMDFEAE